MSLATRINTLIGNLAGKRVFAVRTAQPTPAPFIMWQRIVTTPQTTQDTGAILKASLVQVSCYASTFTAADELRAEALALLEGNHPEGPIILQDERDSFEEEANLHRADADILVWDSD